MVTDAILDLYLISIAVCIQPRLWMGSELCLPAIRVNVSDSWRPARKTTHSIAKPSSRGQELHVKLPCTY